MLMITFGKSTSSAHLQQMVVEIYSAKTDVQRENCLDGYALVSLMQTVYSKSSMLVCF